MTIEGLKLVPDESGGCYSYGRSGLGVALSMGGARGWAHIGVLRGLEKLGIVPEYVTGCSMGALVGAAWAGNRLDALETWAREMTAQAVLSYMDLKFFGGGLVEGRQILGIAERLGLPERIEDLPRRLSVVASDLSTGGEYWFEEGSLADAVRASVAIPAVFSPKRIGDHWLVDGALVDPLPISGCRRMGATRVIAVNANATLGKPLWQPRPQTPITGGMIARVLSPDFLPAGLRAWAGIEGGEGAEATEPASLRDPGYYEIIMTTLDILCEGVLKHRLDLDPPDLMIDLDLRHVGVLELHRAAEVIDAGEAAVAEQADRILAAMEDDPLDACRLAS